MDVSRRAAIREWILCGVCLVTAIIFIICSVTIGNVPKYRDHCGSLAACIGDADYWTDVLQTFEEAKTRLWILCNDLQPSSSLAKAVADAADRGVDVRVIAPANSSLSGFAQVREIQSQIATNMFIADDEVLVVSTLNESDVTGLPIYLGVSGNERLSVDFSRMFTVLWMSADEEEAKSLPLVSGVWDFDLLAIVTDTDRAYVEGGSSVLFAQLQSTYVDPKRTRANQLVASVLARTTNRLLISGTDLDLSSTTGIIVQNVAMTQALRNESSVRILIDYSEVSLRQGAMIAGLCPNCVRVMAHQTLPNLIVVGNAIFFSTCPASMTLRPGPVGAGILVEDSESAALCELIFDQVWNTSMPFKEAFDKFTPV